MKTRFFPRKTRYKTGFFSIISNVTHIVTQIHYHELLP
nr:MAG TPA: hypothetical protein [Caudoviricetes sp.]